MFVQFLLQALLECHVSHRSSQIYCTVGSDEEAEQLATHYDIPRTDIFSCQDSSFLAGVMTATKGTGVDVVLNSLRGDLFYASCQCVAEFGSLVNISPRDEPGDQLLAMGSAKRNVTRIDVDMRHVSRHRPDISARYGLPHCSNQCESWSELMNADMCF